MPSRAPFKIWALLVYWTFSWVAVQLATEAAPPLAPVLAATVGVVDAALDAPAAEADAVGWVTVPVAETLLWQPASINPAAASAKGTERRRREFIIMDLPSTVLVHY